MNLQIIVKFSPPGLILDIGPFDFAAFLNYKNFNTVLCLEGFHPQFALYLLTYPFEFIPYTCLAFLKYALPTYILLC